MPARSISRSRSWRVVDIVVAAVLAVACGAIFYGWGALYETPSNLLSPLLPGVAGLLNGPWLVAGPLVGLVIRKPGAALFGELVAAFIEMVLGGQWGISTLVSGLTQGVGAEIGLALLGYRLFGPLAALLAGALAGVAESITDLTFAHWAYGPVYLAVYSITTTLSGAVFGLVARAITRALAATGVLDRFASGRARSRAV